MTTIEEGAFAYCSGFTGDLVIPNSVVTIEPSAFHTCYAFEYDFSRQKAGIYLIKVNTAKGVETTVNFLYTTVKNLYTLRFTLKS